MYSKYSDKELIEAYSSMIDYSGKPSPDMSVEIERRGGLEAFKEKISRKEIIDQEIQRISKEVYSLTSNDTNEEFVRKLMSSNILTDEELDQVVQSKFRYYKAVINNRTVDSNTYITSIIGTIIASVIGSVFLLFVIIFLTPGLFIYFIIPIYIIDYLIIRFITKKTRSNLVVFIATLIATIISVLLGLYLASNFFLPAA